MKTIKPSYYFLILTFILFPYLANATIPNLEVNIRIIGYDTCDQCYTKSIEKVYLLQIDIINNSNEKISIGYNSCSWLSQFKFIGNIKICDWGGCDRDRQTSRTIEPKKKHTFKIFLRPINKRTKEIQIQYKYTSGDKFAPIPREAMYEKLETKTKGVKLKARTDKPIYYKSNFCKLESKERIPFAKKEELNE